MKELIKQNKGEQELPNPDEEDEGLVDEKTAAIIKKFKHKILREFIPHFMLAQYQGEPFLEYESFSSCVDEYFIQSQK